MAKVRYTKPFIPYSDQVKQLKDRGLKIENDAKVAHLLEYVSYYRLSGYWYPLLAYPKKNHIFKVDADFEIAFKLYCFDRELRKIVTAELEKIEVAIRAKIIYIMSEAYGPFWITSSSLFTDFNKHAYSIAKMSKENGKSDEDFIKSFRNKYSDPLPPCWMILEICSFGNLSSIYQNLNSPYEKRAIANSFGLDETTFESWLHSMVYVRNVCAHHTRLWNRTLSIAPNILHTKNLWLTNITRINNRTGKSELINDRTYYFLSLIVYMLNVINPKHRFKQKFIELLRKYPNIDTRAMGAPANWVQEPLWK